MGTVVFYFSVILILEASIFFAAEKKAAAKNLASKFIIIKNYAGDSKFYNQKNRSENKFSLILL